MSNFESTFFASPTDAILGTINEFTQMRWELNELANTFLRLGNQSIAEELKGHCDTIERLSTLIRRATTQTQNR